MIRNTLAAWGTPARLLHWMVAALVLAQIALGWVAVSLRMSPLKLELFVWHKSIGLVVLALVAVRILWRSANATPAPPAATAAWERCAARASHLLLYLVLIAMPLTGWVLNSAANVPFRIFRLVPLPAIVAPNEEAAELAGRAHLALFVVLAALLVVHVAAALWHHFVRRDDVLIRMLYGARRRA